MEETKILRVYHPAGFERYDELWKYHTYTIDTDRILTVNSRCPSTGEESVVAVYREWLYLSIEKIS